MQGKLTVEVLEPRELLSHTLVIGHRGDSLHAPENTPVSMDRAFRRGAEVVEVDVQFAGDGRIVAMHDTTVDRTTNGTGAVASLTVLELKTLDAGSWFSAEFAGERVPTLAEFLETAARRGIVYLDLKADSMGAAIRQVLDEEGLPDDSVWASAGEEAVARDVHEHLPGTPILWYGDVPRRGTAEYFQGMRSIGVTGFDLRWGEFARGFVRDARANGMFFSTYTINSPRQWRAALRLDLDAIETDDPGGLASFIAARRGEVSVRLTDGTLSIVGDRQHNSIRIEPGSFDGSVRIAGVDGTRINAQGEAVEVSGVRDIVISLGNGNDIVEITDLLLDGGLTADGGRGSDRISIGTSTIRGATELLGRSGSDRFSAQGSMFGPVQVTGGVGFDFLDMGLEAEPNANANNFLARPIYAQVERLAS